MSMANVPDDVPIESKMVTRAIASAQSQVEQQNFEIRKNVLKYDEVLNRQREVIYAERRRVLEGEDLQEQIAHFMDDTVDDYVNAATAEGFAEEWDLDQLWSALGRSTRSRSRGRGRRGGRRPGRGHRRPHLRDDQGRHPRAVRGPRGAARRGDHARARAPRRAVGAGPQVARAPLRDGLPPGGHRPAGDGAARPAGRVPARGLRHVQRHDGRHQGGVRRLPVQPGGPGRAAGRGGRGAGRRGAVPGRHGQARRGAGGRVPSGDPGQGPGGAAASGPAALLRADRGRSGRRRGGRLHPGRRRRFGVGTA